MLTHMWTWGEPRKYQTNDGPSSRQLSQTPSSPRSPCGVEGERALVEAALLLQAVEDFVAIGLAIRLEHELARVFCTCSF